MVDVATELHGRAEAAQRGRLVLRHRTRGGGCLSLVHHIPYHNPEAHEFPDQGQNLHSCEKFLRCVFINLRLRSSFFGKKDDGGRDVWFEVWLHTRPIYAKPAKTSH